MILADTVIFYQFLDDIFLFFLIKWYQLTWSFSSFCKWCLSITYSTNFNEVATTAVVVLLLIKKKRKKSAWVKSWLGRRTNQGFCEMLVQEDLTNQSAKTSYVWHSKTLMRFCDLFKNIKPKQIQTTGDNYFTEICPRSMRCDV